MSARFPDFLGIGAQKAGTTWLHENLRRHPELFLPEEKELHVLDRGLEPGLRKSLRRRRELRRYCARFAAAGGRVCGEITPSYGHLPPERLRLVWRENPELRLILMLRNPIERAWSGASMKVPRLLEREAAAISEQEFRDYLLSEHSIARTRYTTMIDNWSGVFGAEALFLGFFEDLQARPWPLLQDVFRHLGVSAEPDPELFPFERVVLPTLTSGKGVSGALASDARCSARSPVPEYARELLAELYREELRALRERFGSRCAGW